MRVMFLDYTDEEHMYKPDPVGAAYIKKHAGNAGLTSSEMSRIIVESGHKSAILRTGDYRFMGREVRSRKGDVRGQVQAERFRRAFYGTYRTCS